MDHNAIDHGQQRTRTQPSWRSPDHGAKQREDTYVTGPPAYPDSKPNAKRWAWVVGIITIIFVLMIVAVVLVGGGGEHGPAQHL